MFILRQSYPGPFGGRPENSSEPRGSAPDAGLCLELGRRGKVPIQVVFLAFLSTFALGGGSLERQ